MYRLLSFSLVCALLAIGCSRPSGPITEATYYALTTVPIPDDVMLEVGGLTTMDDGRLIATTRRGEVWIIDDVYNERRPSNYSLFAKGLHEPLGIAQVDNAFYIAQRGELTRLEDVDGDERADVFETVYAWPLSGNYHEYSYGPLVLPDGSFFLTMNVAWIGHGASPVPWRGWGVRITRDGEFFPMGVGMRSPAGFGINAKGDIFIAENQGDWIGSGRITHLAQGDFIGHPAGLVWTHLEETPPELRNLKFEDIPDTGEPMHEVGKRVSPLKPPTVWFPHGLLGISTSDILLIDTDNRFGPFEGQMLVGDQGHSRIMRVFLEEVDGEYQGAVFPFREGFSSGILRMTWGIDGSLFVGMTSRGWASTGGELYGLQRLTWTGETPFEMSEIHAEVDGFTLHFTEPVDTERFASTEAYEITGFTYQYHHNYGSPIINQEPSPIRAAEVAADGHSVRLLVENLREGYIHEIKVDSLLSAGGTPLLHTTAYYTLTRIPDGEPMPIAAVAQGRSSGSDAVQASASEKRVAEMPDSWGGAPDRTITLGTRPGLKFDTELLEVTAGSRVRLVFNNNDDMLHNVLITKPGTVDAVGQAALEMGLSGPQKGYVPDSDEVLFHTALLEPETSDTIYFIAPTEPGDYAFVCTFPGHYAVMNGVLRVSAPTS